MMKKLKPPISVTADKVTTFRYGKLKGKIAYYKGTAKNKQRIVLLGGVHSSHERTDPFSSYLKRYGDVYAIDVPGFGEMGSFTKIGKDISYDSYGEFLYTVLKTQKLTKDVMIFTVSIGGQFVTRMLQMYPETHQWISKVIGFVTFGSSKDFNIKQPKWTYFNLLVRTASYRPVAWVMEKTFFSRVGIWLFVNISAQFRPKVKSADPELYKKRIKMELYLWNSNDHHTHAATARMMFDTDLRKFSDELIPVPMHNVVTAEDQYVDNKEVKKTMRDLYSDYNHYEIEQDVHMPSLIANDEEVAKMFDDSIVTGIMGPKE